ncbi:metal ABC transporter ATP-binding protein [Brevibacillus fluminis]|uniref:metal ABC transporter ATP-binding protein n=1 Tax=Brevibacillus fluminis TaxID=511487 RepID=UPI003F8AADA9
MKDANGTKDAIVQLSNVTFQYDDGKTVLDHVNFVLQKGDFLGLVGPNGSGKSTLLKLILGLLPATHGQIDLFGTPINKFREWSKIGYVAQQVAHGAGGFPATVREVIASGLVGKVGLFRRITRQHQALVTQAAERVGLGDKLDKRIGILSGGQLQRVFIARALVAEPQFLILDEPTVGVDQESIDQFYELLRSLKEESELTMMIVSHDVGVMTQWVNKVACLQKGLHFHGTAHEFVHNQEKIMQQMYGSNVHLLAHNH